MKQQSAHASTRFPLRGVLLGVQVAISVVLLAAAALLVRGLEQVRARDTGFEVIGVTLLSVDLPVNQYNEARGRIFFGELMDRVKPLAGASPPGLAAFPPLYNGRTMTSFKLPGKDSESAKAILIQFVNAGYFDVLSVPLVAGRNFVSGDGTRHSIIINEATARRFWPVQNPIGQAIIANNARREVVGVARDARVYGLGPVEPIFFQPFEGGQHATLLLRTGERNPDLSRRLTAIVAQMEPRAVASPMSLADQLDRWLGPSRMIAILAGALGLLALALATVGVYGVISYSVEQRRREIGVRMALGAAPEQIVRFIVRANARAVLCGLSIGLAASLAVSRLLQTSLNGVSPLDPLAYGSVLALLLLAGILASVIPARRAARIDPLVALHYE